jgi:GNAT superfamily N-acetyltransferase
MPELTVRVLDEQDWSTYREVRLAAVQESSGVFGNTHDQEAAADQTFWRSQLTAARRVVAEFDGGLCGVVSVGSFHEEPGSVELFGLWVDPTARSTGVAGRLVDTASTLAAVDGATQMYYWGQHRQRPGDRVRHRLRVPHHLPPSTRDQRRSSLGDTEIALVLPLEDDPHIVPNATASPLRC